LSLPTTDASLLPIPEAPRKADDGSNRDGITHELASQASIYREGPVDFPSREA